MTSPASRKHSRQKKGRKKATAPWTRRIDWPMALLLALLIGAFFLPQRAWLESGWYQLTARFHPRGDSPSPWLMVSADHQSQARLGSWPWDHRQFTLVVEQILAMQPDGLVILQQPPTHWNRESLQLLRQMQAETESHALQDLARQLDSPQALYNLPRLYFASLPGEGPHNWPAGLPAKEVPHPSRLQQLKQRLLQGLLGSPPGLENGGRLYPRPAALIQAPLLRGPASGQARRPAWFELDSQRTPALALRLQLEQAGIPLSRLELQPGLIRAGNRQWQVEATGGYWPSLHPDNLPVISLQQLLNQPRDLRGRWVLLHVAGTSSSRDEWLEAQATVSLGQQNHSLTPWYIPLIQWLLLAVLALWLSRKAQAALSPGWAFSLLGLMGLQLVIAQVLQAWMHWWIRPAWPTLAVGLLLAVHWLRYSGFSWQSNKALNNTRLQLAQSLIAQQAYSQAWSLLKKLPHNPGRFRLLESLHQASAQAGEERLARQVLQQIQQIKPRYQPAAIAPEAATATPAGPDGTEVLEKTDILPAASASDDALSRYQLIEELGRGAMAVVHRARDEKLGREVALKILPLSGNSKDRKQAEIYRRFMQEARAAARLRHPNIVTVYDVGEDGQRAWIAMDLIEGEDLSRHCQARHLLPLEQLLPLMVQVAEALDYAHQKGVIHRDIKPANMLYEKRSGQVVVTDFGVASLQDASQTRTGTVLGSPSYMAPEQVNGKSVDGRADLYALGVSLYQLTTGQLPFQGDTLANVMYRITHEKCTPPSRIRPELPDALEAVILKAMHKQPGKRYPTGKAMARALQEIQSG